MSFSETEIGNLALDLLGNDAIVSLDQEVKSAELLKRNLPLLRDSLLRTYRWNFAKARAVLAPDASAPPFGFQYAFLVPSDFISMVGVFDPEEPEHNYTSGSYAHVVEAGRIHAHLNPLNITYIRQVVDPTAFDPSFTNLLAVKLAQRIAYGLSTGVERSRDLERAAQAALLEARRANAFENTPEVDNSSNWLDAHEGYRYTHGLRNRNSV